jgi:hypothetical protein
MYCNSERESVPAGKDAPSIRVAFGPFHTPKPADCRIAIVRGDAAS